MERIKVILNPFSGRGQAGRSWPRVAQTLTRAGIDFDLSQTERVGHGIELTRQARLAGFSTVLAVGGDGTVSEVVNGLAQAATAGATVGRLAVLPLGSGNDFAAMSGSNLPLTQLAQALTAGKTRQLDLGVVAVHTESERNADPQVRYCDNNIGIGFEAWVTLESYKIRWLVGRPLYVLASLRALRTCPDPQVEVEWETPAGQIERRSGRMLMISVGNSRRTGGGFFLTPQAEMDDGLLDVMLVAATSRWQVLQMLPLALRGAHTNHPVVTMLRCRRLRVTSAEPLPVHVDGEVIATAADLFEVSIQPRRLEVVIP